MSDLPSQVAEAESNAQAESNPDSPVDLSPAKPQEQGGRRLLFFCDGSRGDVQPQAALALAFRREGYRVRVVANVNHAEFLRSLGLDAGSAGADIQALIMNNKAVRALMAGKAEIPKDAKALEEAVHQIHVEHFPACCDAMIREMDEFRPDVAFASSLNYFEAACITGVKGVPMVSINLSPNAWPSRDFQTSFLHRGGCFPHLTLGNLLLEAFWRLNYRGKAEVLFEKLPGSRDIIVSSPREIMLSVYHPFAPILNGFSPSLAFWARDWTEDLHDRTVFSGFWTLSEEAQEESSRGGNAFFGGGEHSRLQEFLAAGEEPVYMGWGSMIPAEPKAMALLAVRALMKADVRGVVLGGWGGLEVEHLKDEADSEALMAFAQQKVLFVRTAPHEWLFPKCCTQVHHGGIGTTAASVRSGRPCVITPCAFDQFDNASILRAKGVGVEMRHFNKVTAEELAAAITRCRTDQKMISAARKLGETVRAEDGFAPCLQAIGKFLAEEVDTGKWKAAFEERQEEVRHLRAHKRCCKGPRWLCRMWCSSSPNEYLPKKKGTKL